VGDAPPQYRVSDEDEDEDGDDGDEESEEKPTVLPEHLAELAPLAEAVLALSDRLDTLYEEDEAEHGDDDETSEPAGPPKAIVSLFRELSKAALALAAALEEDEEALHELDEWSQERELLPRLLELPLGLVTVSELDSALAVARAFTFVAAESCNADIAIIFAESGKRDEALAQLEANFKQFPESWLTAIRSGEAFEALGDSAAAEAAYRRGMILAEDGSEEEEAFTLLAGLLDDMGRVEELEALLSSSTDGLTGVGAKPLAPVGRNDPCPCGSGKKYKKCHGA
jgi:tetratricopeptide (TPR) repeat protein